MPVRKKKAAKKKPLKKKKKVAKKTRKAPAKKKVAKKGKKSAAKKRAARAVAVQSIKEKVLGKVTHYYDRIGVAIIRLQSPLKLGDAIRFTRGEHSLEQSVSSLQINHMPVLQAKKGDVVGLKVDAEVHPGAVVIPL